MKLFKTVLTLALLTNISFAFSLGDITKMASDSLKQDKTSQDSSTLKTSDSMVSSGLKEALNKGVEIAVETLGKENGYLNNDLVKIPLPDNLAKIEGIIRNAGGAQYADELIKSMNDAATQATPKTANIFIDAIEKMSIDDAQKILNGSNTDATQYFKDNTYTQLKELIKPIVQNSIASNQVASYYDAFNNFYKTQASGYVKSSGVMDYAKSFGVDSYLPSENDANLDDYITSKAIDGLFLMIEKEEVAIRENPIKRTTDLLKEVFK